MALRLILGSSGSGKSTYLYEEIIRQAKAHPCTNYYVIVPEQFTMQTQRELVVRSGNGIMNIDVVSFQRLAYRIFDELGKQDMVVLEETGKNLLLRKVAQEKKEELLILAGNMKKMGYVSEIKSLISELTQYQISPDDLENFLCGRNLPHGFLCKMQDILTMYRGFEEAMEDRYVTAEEILDVFSGVAGQSKLLENSVLAFDGFTGFTPIQNHLMQELFGIASDIYVTVTIDPSEDFYTYRDMQELFAMSKKTIVFLMKMAERMHVDVAEPYILTGEGQSRHTDAPMLAALEKNLFRPHMTPYRKEDTSIRIYGLMNPREELLFTAGEIRRLVREEGLRYKDIAVVTGDVEGYGNYVPQIFTEYEIPYFLDTTKNILLHPFIEFIRAVLEILENDFSYDSMFRYFRSNLAILPREGYGWEQQDTSEYEKITTEQIDRLENYVLATGIRGYKAWTKRFSYLPKHMTMEQLEELNRIRELQMQLFTELYEVFHTKHVTVRQQSVALYQFLIRQQIERQLKQREQMYRDSGEFVKEKEYAQIYRIVMDLLDKLTSLLGEDELTIAEYTQILDAGFEAAKVGVIPSGYDRVTVGDIERSRLDHIKVLFFIGVNDGIVPKNEARGGIISQLEREELARQQLELAPTARERVFIQRFYLYLMLTKPSMRLYLSYAGVGKNGQALRRSYLIGTLQKIFPLLPVTELGELPVESRIVTPKSSMEFFVEGLQLQEEQRKADDQVRKIWYALKNWYEQRAEYRPLEQQLLLSHKMRYEAHPISHAVANALYGTVLENSVTRLEQFAACACAHFLSYGLHLKEREISQFAALDMGNIYHMALEKYASMIEQSDTDWFHIEREQRKAFIEEALHQAILETGNQALAQTSKNQYFLYRMKKILYRTVDTLTTQVQSGKFTPDDFEVAFAFTDNLAAVNFALSEDEKMHLRGRIDRVDTYEQDQKLYVKIIDYKSGNTNFELLSLYHGLQLQLVVYLNAAMEVLQKKHPEDTVVPAGIFYYHIDDPVIDGKGNETDVEIYDKIIDKLKLNGLVNADATVYEAMDTNIGTSSKMIPIQRNKDGSLSKRSHAVSEEQFAVLSDYVNQKIHELGTRIMNGEVQTDPYRMKDRGGCSYCAFGSVCGFDRKIPGYQERRLEENYSEDELLQHMEEAVRKENP